MRELVIAIASKHGLDHIQVLELFDHYVVYEGMPELDAAAKALALVSVLHGIEPQDPEEDSDESLLH